MPRPRLLAYVLLLGASLLWGSLWLANQQLGPDSPPLTVLALRYGFAALLLLLPGALSRQPLLLGQNALLGLTLLAGPNLLVLFSSEQGVGSISPLFFAALPLGLSIAGGQLSVAALVGLSAVATLMANTWPTSLHAALWTLPMAAAVALQGWSLLQLARQPTLRTPRSLAVQLASAAAALGLLALLTEHPSLPMLGPQPARTLLTLLVLAVAGTALPYLLFFRALCTLPAQQAAGTQWLQLLTSVYGAAWFFHIRPTALMLAASVVLLGSLGALFSEQP